MNLVEAGASHTDWSMIAAAGQPDEEGAAAALEGLVRRYWSAVYAYIRSTGRDVHEAADMTQGFICDVIISRRLCAVADPNRGRFRSLLLTAVKTYLREQHRHQQRQCRSGAKVMPIRFVEPETVVMDSSTLQDPEAAYRRQWSATLVRHVLDTVRSGCLTDALDAHWTIFEHRVVRPLLLGEPATEYAELVDRLGLKDASQAANMMVTVKRRFANALCDEVARTVNNRDSIADEIGELLRDFEGTR